MAFNPGDNNVSPVPTPTSTGATDPTAMVVDTGSLGAGRIGLLGGGAFGSAISKSVGSEYLKKIADGMAEIFKSANDRFKLSLIVLDRSNEIRLAYSTIVVAAAFNKSTIDRVVVHTLIIEATGEELQPVIDNFQQQQIEITKLTSDAYDPELARIVKQRVSALYQGAKIQLCDATVVPRDFDPENEVMIRDLAYNSSSAAVTELEISQPGFLDLNVVEDAKGVNLIVNMDFGRNVIQDVVGMPNRSDITFTVRAQRQGQQNQNTSIHQNDREQVIAQLSGYVDFGWLPVEQQMAMMYQNPLANKQKFGANLILTNIASTKGYSPGMVLLALVMAATANNDYNWLQSFLPTSGAKSKTVEMNDIGALNIEGRLEHRPDAPVAYGAVPDLRGSANTVVEIGTFVSQLVRPGLAIAIDIPDAGPQTWYTNVFMEAATGSVSATKIIIDAANRLTNNEFASLWTPGRQIFTDVNAASAGSARLHLGYWTDNDGRKRDIRDVDYLAVANMVGRKNPEYIKDWAETFLSNSWPLHMCLARRKQMITTITHDPKFVGFATRRYFSSDFLTTLITAFTKTGVIPQVKTPRSSLDFNQQRGAATYLEQATLQPTLHFGHSGSYAGYQNGIGVVGQRVNRF